MSIGRSVVVSGMALVLVFFASWADADNHVCLSIERPWVGSLGLWVNGCDVGVDVLWFDEGSCKSEPGKKYPCGSYVAPNSKTTATLEGRVGWSECKSPSGLGDVVTMQRPDGSTYCGGDLSPRERANLVRRQERKSQELQRRRLQVEKQRQAQAQRQPAPQERRPVRQRRPEQNRQYWGAFVQVYYRDANVDLGWGASWNARTPKQALDAAIQKCSDRSGQHCDPFDRDTQVKVFSTFSPVPPGEVYVFASVPGYPEMQFFKLRCIAVFDDFLYRNGRERHDFVAGYGNTKREAEAARGVHAAIPNEAILLMSECNSK